MDELLKQIETLKAELKEKDEYILDLEEENENLSEYNRQLIERIKDV